jgi:hypothetical protein
VAWFTRKDRQTGERFVSRPESPTRPDAEPPLRPVIARLGVKEQQRIDLGRQALADDGVDIDDLRAIGAAFDAALAGWMDASKRHRESHDVIVERFAIGIGEHLARHTDLSWAVVTDAFGTDLAVAGGLDEFVVVPANLVATRWLNAERGWVPGVVSHLVRLRAAR